jgi:hypothetical protein
VVPASRCYSPAFLDFGALVINRVVVWLRSFEVKSAVLLEAGAAIIFFGSLVQNPDIARYGVRALHELSLRGYEISTASDPVRTYPIATAGEFSASHAGGWRPGVISLRVNPQGSSGLEAYLRHELMHEASFRTCKGKLPLWAEEAAAISFSREALQLPFVQGASEEMAPVVASQEALIVSGGLSTPSCPIQATDRGLESLRKRVRVGARLDQENYRTLSSLVACYGWPLKPCARSEAIEALLAHPQPPGETGFSYLLVSLTSGRNLESQGDLNARHPPGSLLKIPYAAALKDGFPEALGKELAASDTQRLLARKSSFDLERFRFLISPVKGTSLDASIPQQQMAGKDEGFWRQYLGERGEDGSFPLEASLPELAEILRASLLRQPDYFSGLSQNGFMEGSTLYGEHEAEKQILEKLHAMSKTGTAADERGNPLVGHLMVAWPAEDPAFLAVFRSFGVNGAANLRRAATILDKWDVRRPWQSGKVRVRLLALTPRASWEILDKCPAFEREAAKGRKDRVSICGRFRITSAARGSRPERVVSGVLSSSQNGQEVILETDPETYADAVLAAEAQELQGEARKALRAVIVWNGAHGRWRHEDSASLCDSTHCMVFQGSLPEVKEERGNRTDPSLLKLLDDLAVRRTLDWLPFSKGGDEPWVKEVSVSKLLMLAGEPTILDLRRERTRTGEVAIHLMYPENEEVIPCEAFRHRLKLLSCPEAIHYDQGKSAWVFSGIGEGHGEGLSVARARALSLAGHRASAILADAYR